MDAFCHDWARENNWLVPPVFLVPRVIRYLAECQAEGILIFPEWVSSVTCCVTCPYLSNPYLEIPGCLRSVVPAIKKKDDLFITRFFLFFCLLSVSGLLIQFWPMLFGPQSLYSSFVKCTIIFSDVSGVFVKGFHRFYIRWVQIQIARSSRPSFGSLVMIFNLMILYITSNNQRLANAGEDIFLLIWGIKDWGPIGKGRVILFVHPSGFTRFFLHFDSNNRVILQNL